jgi:hypothetical protein
MAEIRPNLLPCTEKYALFNNDEGIKPLSKIDAEILSVFFGIMTKLGANKNLEKIIDAYKLMPDMDFLSILEEYSDSLQPLNKTTLINIKNQFIGIVNSIDSFTRISDYDFKTNKLMYALIINKTENVKVPYANTQITFSSEEELEGEFERIKEKLNKYSNIIFI